MSDVVKPSWNDLDETAKFYLKAVHEITPESGAEFEVSVYGAEDGDDFVTSVILVCYKNQKVVDLGFVPESDYRYLNSRIAVKALCLYARSVAKESYLLSYDQVQALSVLLDKESHWNEA